MAEYAGFGAILQQFNTTDGYVTIAHVDDIQAPALGLGTPDVTAHDSADAHRGFVGGVKEIGEVSLALVFDPAAATHVAGWTALASRGSRVFKLIFPDVGNTEWAFMAFVTGFEPNAPVEDKLAASVTLLGTGKPQVESDFVFLLTEAGEYLVDESGSVLVES